ncbi:MAG: radical SAM protein [Myxococcota bacterium]
MIAQCNLRCSHCFADPLPRGARDPLTLSELDRLFGELAALGSFRLGLTGGEPLLRRDLLDILDAATGAGLHPCLTTNGFFLSDEIARELGRRELVWLNVSLDGASPETNDAVRGAGSFETVMDRLRHLRDLARFTLAFTITSGNAHEVDECVRLAEKVGAHTAVFRPVYPTGAALQHPKLMPQFQMYQGALRRLSELSAHDADSDCAHGPLPGRALDPFSPQARAQSSGKVTPGHGCGAANTVCSVSVDGKVNPCSFLGSRFNSASIREQSFKQIWDEGWSFMKLRAEKGEAFKGGCRARSLALRGSVHARDPWEAEWRHGAAEHPSRTLEVVVDR